MPNPKNLSQVCSGIKIYGFRPTFTIDTLETGLWILKALNDHKVLSRSAEAVKD